MKKGQNIVWFDTEAIDKQIKNAETDFQLAKLTKEEDEFNYKQFLETQSLDKAAAERKKKQAQQSFDNFAQVDRERQLKTAEQNLKSSQASLDNAKEELKQLEQMYKEDDLTEASEEIVLKRAKQSVEFAEFRLEGTKISSERTVKQSVPRSDLEQKESLNRALMTYDKTMLSLRVARQRQDIEIAKKRDQFKEKEADLKELREERKKVVLQTPIEGIVLHGKVTRGKISDKPSTIDEGTKVTAKQVIATIVNPARLQVRVDLAEKQLAEIKVGQKCTIVPSAFPQAKINGTVKSISSVPYAGTKFDCVVSFRNSKNVPNILPTMTCELQFETEAKNADSDKNGKKG